jgi:nitronate monooxygenase
MLLRVSSSTLPDLLGIEHPIVQAGMARGFTNASLVSAVSEAGGLGVLGCLNRSPEETDSEIRRIRSTTSRPFGVNFVVEHLDDPSFEVCLRQRVPVFTFFRGDPRRVIERAHAVGAIVVYQVTTPAEAQAALEAGADVLVAQGREAGGHVGPIPLRTLLPAVIAIAGDRPVLAAGGIVDGATLTAALADGAAGAWIGTRFVATVESPASAAHKQAIVDATPGSTIRTPVWDRIWGRPWPGVQVRVLRNAVTERWIAREAEIEAHRASILRDLEAAAQRDDGDEVDLLAGEGAAWITSVRPAAAVVLDLAGTAVID